MPDQERYDHTVTSIDGALRDFDTSDDAMRWTPETPETPEPTPTLCDVEVAVCVALGLDPGITETGSIALHWERHDLDSHAFVTYRTFEQDGPHGFRVGSFVRLLTRWELSRLTDAYRQANDILCQRGLWRAEASVRRVTGDIPGNGVNTLS